jgi:nitrate/TMAO reductase-like tetraheme cytochrome c subunit
VIHRFHRGLLPLTLLTGAVLIGLIWLVPQVAAGSSSSTIESAPNGARLDQAVTNEVCLGCHSNQSLTKKLYDDSDLSLYISGDDLAHSVHGQSGIACVQCHTNFDQKHGENPVQYPGFNAADRRDASLQLVKLCGSCHADQSAKQNDSVHSRAQAAGNRDAAICTDCHTAHTVRKLTDPSTKQLLPDARLWVPQTCAKCHNDIYEKYKASVHGAALIQENNLDVPTCIDCHGVHNIPDPTTDAFRLKSPSLCAKCHTNAQIMDRYGISTQVLNTYVADFHGTTVTLFEKQSPDAPTNKPVCFDCHGIHDIARVDDPQKGLAIRENILKRCQVCHPTATANFSSAWLSHYIPSQDKTPLVYFVNLFYQIFIPGVLGGMAVLVLLDVSWRVRRRFRKPAPAVKPAAAPPASGAPVAPAPDQPAAPIEAAPVTDEAASSNAAASSSEPSSADTDQSADGKESNHG